MAQGALRASGPGTAAAQFLKIGAGARPEAMGGAYGAVGGDPYALYWNPAGLGRLDKPRVSLSYAMWLEQVNNSYLAYAHPFPKLKSVAAVSVNTLSVPQIQMYDNTGAASGKSYTAADTALSFGVSREAAKGLWAGAGFKSISSRIDDAAAGAFACDAGLLYARGMYAFCAAVQNMGGKIKFVSGEDPLPLNFKAGAAYSLPEKGLLFALDVNMPSDNSARVNAGAEYSSKVSEEVELAARAGARTNTQGLDAISAVTAGFGLRWRWMDLDVSWSPYGDLGDVFRTSVAVRFGEPQRAAPAKPVEKKPVQPAKPAEKPVEQPKAPKPAVPPAAPAPAVKLSTATAQQAAPPQQPEKNEQLKRDYLFRGQGFFFAGKYDDSLTCFKKALEIEPNNAEAKDYIARINKMKAEKKASEKAEQGKQDGLKHELFLKGQEYYAAGEYKKALSYFDNVLAIDPFYADAYKYINKIHKIIDKNK